MILETFEASLSFKTNEKFDLVAVAFTFNPVSPAQWYDGLRMDKLVVAACIWLMITRDIVKTLWSSNYNGLEWKLTSLPPICIITSPILTTIHPELTTNTLFLAPTYQRTCWNLILS